MSIRRRSAGAPSTVRAMTPSGRNGTRFVGIVVTPQPPATSLSLVSQSRALCAIRGLPASPGHTPNSGSAPLDALAIQSTPASSSVVTDVRPVNRPVAGAAMSRLVSSRISVWTCGSSVSGGRCGGREVMTARSRVPARSARRRAGVEPSLVARRTSGRVRRRLATHEGRMAAPPLTYMPSRTSCGTDSRPSSSLRAMSSSSRTTRACLSNVRPALVNRVLPGRRSNKATPASRSSAATCRETADCV